MPTSTLRLYSLDYSEVKTYMVAALFIIGNIALPQLVHLMPQGGMIGSLSIFSPSSVLINMAGKWGFSPL